MRTKISKRVPRTGHALNLKLRPELVPQPLWGISACRLLRRRAPWKQIRNETLEDGGYRCSVCSDAAPPLICHERWHYDSKQGIALLDQFVTVCRACNFALHPGMAEKIGQGDAAIAQLCRVNRISKSKANQIVSRAMRIWEKRNAIIWQVTVAPTLLRAHPALEILEREKPGVHDSFLTCSL